MIEHFDERCASCQRVLAARVVRLSGREVLQLAKHKRPGMRGGWCPGSHQRTAITRGSLDRIPDAD